MSLTDFIYFIGHLLHATFTGCPKCKDEIGFSWRRFLIKLGYGKHKQKDDRLD